MDCTAITSWVMTAVGEDPEGNGGRWVVGGGWQEEATRQQGSTDEAEGRWQSLRSGTRRAVSMPVPWKLGVGACGWLRIGVANEASQLPE